MKDEFKLLNKFLIDDLEREQEIIKLIKEADRTRFNSMKVNWLDALWYRNEIIALGNLLIEINIEDAKQRFYLSGRLSESMVIECDSDYIIEAAYHRMAYALVSDNQALIQRYAHLKDSKYTKHIEKASLVVTMQFALQENWEELQNMMDRFDFLIEKRKEKWRVPDRKFFMGLLNQNQSQMEDALHELVSKRVHSIRNRYIGEVIRHFVSHPALGYAKLAWLKGYEVQVDSPLIPKQLLPVCPLDQYKEYDFLSKP